MLYRFILSALIFVLPIHCMNILREKYPWPTIKPNVLPDPQSMFSNTQYMKKILNPNLTLIVELGSWLGGSTRFILDGAPNSVVLAIDHWKGSPEHQNNEWSHKLPTLYETFLVNCWHYRHRLIPMKTTTLQGLQDIYDAGLRPDLFYVDAGHDYDSVMADLEKIHTLFPTSHIVGDDWGWPTVRNAVIDFANKHRFSIFADDNFWDIVSTAVPTRHIVKCPSCRHIRLKVLWSTMQAKRQFKRKLTDE